MFEYLQSVRPEITVGALKDGLAQIGRQDVTDMLIKHEKCESCFDLIVMNFDH